jgi:hypothetical protein
MGQPDGRVGIRGGPAVGRSWAENELVTVNHLNRGR